MGPMTFNVFIRKPYQNDEDMLILAGGLTDYREAAKLALHLMWEMQAARVDLGYVSVGVIEDDGYVRVQFLLDNFDFLD